MKERPPVSAASFHRLTPASASEERGPVAEEVPVAIVYRTRPHAVVMATPADLEDLAVGFTLSEQIVSGLESIADIRVQHHARGIDVAVDIPADVVAKLADRARSLAVRTGCGLCGVEAIEDAVRAPVRVTSSLTFEHAALWRAAEELGRKQVLNEGTHAIHAAAWATADGAVQFVREDVGRHNALDKVLGALVRAGRNPAEGFLVVTSRASFELV
ncbi:MAG TPA: formate dehydrogenase accessory sulfurtransferase FdhD, partial [Gemmatimonadaceae bacterium]|nr:formate dehydrogenase accessory sulfurtransferase FdhD [Gemmatimonadaceae bacterium]